MPPARNHSGGDERESQHEAVDSKWRKQRSGRLPPADQRVRWRAVALWRLRLSDLGRKEPDDRCKKGWPEEERDDRHRVVRGRRWLPNKREDASQGDRRVEGKCHHRVQRRESFELEPQHRGEGQLLGHHRYRDWRTG